MLLHLLCGSSFNSVFWFCFVFLHLPTLGGDKKYSIQKVCSEICKHYLILGKLEDSFHSSLNLTLPAAAPDQQGAKVDGLSLSGWDSSTSMRLTASGDRRLVAISIFESTKTFSEINQKVTSDYSSPSLKCKSDIMAINQNTKK